MASATVRLADVDRSATDMITFDDSKLAKVKPGLAAAEGFNLSPSQLRDIFGITPEAFQEMPARLVVPDLASHQADDGSYQVTGFLYLVEPVEWVPRVHRGATVPLSALKPNFQESQPVAESQFNTPGIAAQLATKAATTGLYRDTKAEPLTNKPIPSSLSACPIHQLTVFPLLRVRALKRQRIDLHVATSAAGGKEDLWWANSDTPGYWDKVGVSAGRVADVIDFQLHPIPLNGDPEVAQLVWILPVPQFSADASDGELSVTTLVSRSGWHHWYIWEECPWEAATGSTDDQGELLLVAAPQNQAAFKAATVWTPLPTRAYIGFF
ncbi:uncharacterized protein B0T15DRAFT_85375 [Chaetomium strumarium]|uniref:Uncharacterized protein n=1 Tax=Chaetomium strumarium TaxID=1170767 RepID=A0AAJ0GXY9_9PEZI|nr:hypothetical protein B0T15DRAFT_85375 [Chaetomium strumarium]